MKDRLTVHLRLGDDRPVRVGISDAGEGNYTLGIDGTDGTTSVIFAGSLPTVADLIRAMTDAVHDLAPPDLPTTSGKDQRSELGPCRVCGAAVGAPGYHDRVYSTGRGPCQVCGRAPALSADGTTCSPECSEIKWAATDRSGL